MYGHGKGSLPAILPVTGAAGATIFGADATMVALAFAAGLAAWAMSYVVAAKFGKR
jgi:hypothetical protein